MRLRFIENRILKPVEFEEGTEAQIKSLRAAGDSWAAIGAALGVSTNTAYRYAKKQGIETHRLRELVLRRFKIKIMTEAGLSQNQIARRLGVDRRTVQRHQKGKSR